MTSLMPRRKGNGHHSTCSVFRDSNRRIINKNHLHVFVRSLNSLQSEEIVSELVYSFLIPEVQKISVRKRGLRDFMIPLYLHNITECYLYTLLDLTHMNQWLTLSLISSLCCLPVHQKQHRHLQAARSVIQEAAECSGSLSGTVEASQFTCPSDRASNEILKERISEVDQEGEEGSWEAPRWLKAESKTIYKFSEMQCDVFNVLYFHSK